MRENKTKKPEFGFCKLLVKGNDLRFLEKLRSPPFSEISWLFSEKYLSTCYFGLIDAKQFRVLVEECRDVFWTST